MIKTGFALTPLFTVFHPYYHDHHTRHYCHRTCNSNRHDTCLPVCMFGSGGRGGGRGEGGIGGKREGGGGCVSWSGLMCMFVFVIHVTTRLSLTKTSLE